MWSPAGLVGRAGLGVRQPVATNDYVEAVVPGTLSLERDVSSFHHPKAEVRSHAKRPILAAVALTFVTIGDLHVATALSPD
jgi:hypothetical protein